MIKFAEITQYTAFIENSIKSQDDFFDNYMMGRVEILKTLRDDVKKHNKEYTQVINKKKQMVEDENNLEEKTYRDFFMGFNILKAINKDLAKHYFKDITPSQVKNKLELIQKVFIHVLSVMESEKNNHLDDLKETYINNLTAIEQFLSLKTDIITDKEVFSKDLKEKTGLWSDEYKRLKLYIKGYLVGTNQNYKIFFKDLAKKRKKGVKPKKDDLKPENNLHELK